MATTTRRAAAAALAAMGAAACAPLFSRVAFAQDPRAAGGSQRIIVPFAAGGTADGLGRLVAEILNESLAAQYTIDNRSGRNGSLGAEIAARARPDGRTLLLGTLGTAVTNPYLYKHLEYDAEGSFTPVALVGEVANVLLVHPAFPALTLAAFVEHCRRLERRAINLESKGDSQGNRKSDSKMLTGHGGQHGWGSLIRLTFGSVLGLRSQAGSLGGRRLGGTMSVQALR